MIRVRLNAGNIPGAIFNSNIVPLDTRIGPTEFVNGTPNQTQLVLDYAAAASAIANAQLFNLSPFTIYYGFGTPTGDGGLTTANGMPLPANSYVTLDQIGGMSIWYTTGTPQTAGKGLRILGGYVA